MPTYVFRCEQCQHEFSIDVPYAEKKAARCPACGGASLKEMFGRYTLNVLGNGNAADSGACGCGGPGGG